MKKWAKILFWIGIIWIILIFILSVILYFKVKQFSGRMLDQEDMIAMGGWRGIIETIHQNSPLTDIFFYFLKFGIPAWILFIIVGIWGREKNLIVS